MDVINDFNVDDDEEAEKNEDKYTNERYRVSADDYSETDISELDPDDILEELEEN
jgi:hypothetical protein